MDIQYARELGYGVKLLAIAKDTQNSIEVRVHPTFIPINHPLYAVRDAFNAVYIKGDSVGELMFYGRGAGDMPTGSRITSYNVCYTKLLRFHPEVMHTPKGREMLSNFLYNICGCKGDWQMSSFVENSIKSIKEKVGDKKVLCALSGGVDSSVAAVMIHKAIGIV